MVSYINIADLADIQSALIQGPMWTWKYVLSDCYEAQDLTIDQTWNTKAAESALQQVAVADGGLIDHDHRQDLPNSPRHIVGICSDSNHCDEAHAF